MTFYPVQAPKFRLAGSGILSGDTTIKLQSMALSDGTLLTMSDFGDIGYATLEPGTSREEQISFEGITQNDDSTATLTTVTRGLDFTEPYAENNDLKLAHAGSTTLVISNTAKFYTKFMVDANDETITGKHTFSQIPSVSDADTVVPSDDKDLMTVKYGVSKGEDEEITGQKTFTTFPRKSGSETPVEDGDMVTKKHYDDTGVKLTGNQTVAGVKTFSSQPDVPDTTSSDVTKAANVKYVNDTASFGAPDASPTVKGITKITTDAENATEPIAVSDTDPDMNATRYLRAKAQDTPDLTLKVSPANVYFGNTLVEFAGGNSPSFTAPTSNPRIDILSLNDTGTLIRTAGDEGVTPTAPTIPAGNIPIAQVYNRVGQTSIKDEDDSSNGYIYKDLRPFIKHQINPITRVYTSDDTWTKPAGLTYIEVELVGAGGGGGGNNGNGDSGNASNFGSHLGANGGGGGQKTTGENAGAGGVGVNGDLNISGGAGDPKRTGGSNSALPGNGGASLFGFGGVSLRYGDSSGRSGQAYGGGGSGCYQTVSGSNDRGGAGGGGGGYSRKVILADDLGANETVTVGVGGAGGSAGYLSGGNGANGIVIVKEYYV